MTKIILEIPNHHDVQLLIAFAKRLNATVVEFEKKEEIPQSPIYWLEQLAQLNTNSFREIESLKTPIPLPSINQIQ